MLSNSQTLNSSHLGFSSHPWEIDNIAIDMVGSTVSISGKLLAGLLVTSRLFAMGRDPPMGFLCREASIVMFKVELLYFHYA